MRMQSIEKRVIPAATAIAIGILLMSWPGPALAQVGAALDGSTEALKTVLTQAGATLGFWARQLLIGLVVLDFVWRGGRWAFSGQSISAFAEPTVYTIGIVTLAWAFTSMVPDVVGWITWQATVLSNAAQPGAGSALKPSEMMSEGLGRALQWIGEMSWDPASWVFLLCAGISLIVMAAELAMVFLVYAEIHLVGLVGIATLGFAGLTQTRGVAKVFVMVLFAKGFKLLTLLLVVDATHRLAQAVVDATMTDLATSGGGPMQLAQDVVIEPSVTVAGAMGAVLMQIVGVVLVIMLPGAVERLVGGTAVGDVAGTGGRMIAGAGTSAMMTAGAAVAAGTAGAVAGGAAPVVKSGLEAAKTGAPFPGKAAAKAGLIGALQGGVNWGALGKNGNVLGELGGRLQRGVNRIGTGSGEDAT